MRKRPTADIPGSKTLFLMPYTRRRSYPVISASNVFDSAQSPLIGLVGDRRALLVTTPTVYALYGASVRAFCCDRKIDTLVLSVDEESKTHSSAERICRKALEIGLDRRSMLIAVGGGVCTDLTSYAASLIRRGIDCVRIPTTLMGQVDAGIGVKTAVNFDGKKSYLGCFYPPMAAVLDPTFLRSLPPRHFRLGLAEIVKIALVCDSELFAQLEAAWPRFVAGSFENRDDDLCTIIESAARRMLQELKGNLFEDRTYMRLVDAGHTFSPQIEAASGFSIHHGDAVAIDLSLSATIAAVAGLFTWDEQERVIGLIRNIGLPIHTPLLNGDLCERALVEALLHRGGQSNLVLPTRIGSGTFVDLFRDFGPAVISAALARLGSEDATITVGEPPEQWVDSELGQ